MCVSQPEAELLVRELMAPAKTAERHRFSPGPQQLVLRPEKFVSSEGQTNRWTVQFLSVRAGHPTLLF